MKVRARIAAASTLLAAAALVGATVPASAAIHEIVASFCSGGNGNLFPPDQSAFGSTSFLRALVASGAITILPDTPTAGAITLDYNNDAAAGKFTGGDVFFEVIPGIWIEVLEPDHAAFDHCTNFAFEG